MQRSTVAFRQDITGVSTTVYNIEVEEDQSYVANGLVVHNCDYHVEADMYGLGPGTYPIDAAPPIALHPYDRCEYFPRTRSTKDAFRGGQMAPKPSPETYTDPATWAVRGKDTLTEAARARVEDQARRALELGRDSFKGLRERRAA